MLALSDGFIYSIGRLLWIWLEHLYVLNAFLKGGFMHSIGYIPCLVGLVWFGLVWMFICLEHTRLNEFVFGENCTMADCTMVMVHIIV